MSPFHNVHLIVREKLFHVHVLSALRVIPHESSSSGSYLQRILALRKYCRDFLCCLIICFKYIAKYREPSSQLVKIVVKFVSCKI